MAKRRVYSATVYRISETGGKMWPEARFESENKDDLPQMEAKARKRYAEQIRAGTHSIELEEYDAETIAGAIRFSLD